MIVPTISALFLASQLVSAVPFTPSPHLPRDITHISRDENDVTYRAYKRDGSLYGTFSDYSARDVAEQTNASCTPLSIDQAKLLPGFAQIDKYAADTWGNGNHTTLTNPPDYPNQNATACPLGSFSAQPQGSSDNSQTKFLAHGWIWYDYDATVQGHYKWAVNMDALLPNQDDRTGTTGC